MFEIFNALDKKTCFLAEIYTFVLAKVYACLGKDKELPQNQSQNHCNAYCTGCRTSTDLSVKFTEIAAEAAQTRTCVRSNVLNVRQDEQLMS